MKTLRHMRGMTLIELMVVVSIVAILGTFAISSYRNYLLRTNRTDARQALLRIQVAEEKFFLQNNTYTTDFTSAPSAGGLGVSGATTNGGYYTLTVTPGGTGIASSYVATATATAGQTADTAACLTLSINDQGSRTPDDSSGCWK